MKKKKKKLLQIKKKLNKLAKKKKLKKSRAKKLKRVEEKLKKIDKILNGDKYVLFYIDFASKVVDNCVIQPNLSSKPQIVLNLELQVNIIQNNNKNIFQFLNYG